MRRDREKHFKYVDVKERRADKVKHTLEVKEKERYILNQLI